MFISLDLETTGFDPTKDKIIEFGAIKFDLDKNGEAINTETLQFLCNPGIKLPPLITYLTKIKDEDLNTATNFKDKSEEIKNFLGDYPIIGHNIAFDTNFLKANAIELNNPEYDTCELTSVLFPQLPSYSLEVLSSYFQLNHEEKHRALDDAIAAMELFLKLKDHFQSLDENLFNKIQNLLQKSSWPLKKFLLELKNQAKETENLIAKKTGKEAKENPKTENFENLIEKDLIEKLNSNNSELFEINPPYTSLVNKLIQETDKESYIAISDENFREITANSSSTTCIDLPKNYISLKRFEKFQNKENFEDYEIKPLIKTLIWLKNTKTGLFNEMNFFHDERKIIPHIQANEDEKEEKFITEAKKMDKNAAAICSHEYLIENKKPLKKAIIIDFEDFTKKLFTTLSFSAKLSWTLIPLQELEKIFPQNETPKKLLNKCESIFGLITTLFEKTSDHNFYNPRGVITNIELNGNEWKLIKDLIASLFELSKDLGEIINEESLPHLKNWKSSLLSLHEIFFNPHLDQEFIYLEAHWDKEIIIKKIPLQIEESLNKILENFANYQLIGKNLDLNDEGKYIKKLYGLNPQLPLYQHKNSSNPEIFAIEDFPENDKDIHKMAEILAEFAKNNEEPIAIVLSSKKNIELFTIALSKILENSNIQILSQLTGSANKLCERLKQKQKNTLVIMTPNAWTNFESPHLIKHLFIHKIPFIPPGDSYISALSMKASNAFTEIQIPQAIFNLKNLVNRNPDSRVYLLDSRIVKKDYGESFIQNLNKISAIKITSLDELSRSS